MYQGSYLNCTDNIEMLSTLYQERDEVKLFLSDLWVHRSILHSTADDVHELLCFAGFHRLICY